MSKAVGYVRVSTGGQVNGVLAQKDAIESWASQNGVTIVSWFEDIGVSGDIPPCKRNGLLSALRTSLDQKMDLVVAKTDRLSRTKSGLDGVLAWLEAWKQNLYVADGVNPSEEIRFVEYEIENIRTRTKAALASRKNRNLKWTGNLPLGLMAEGEKVTYHEGELDAISRVLELRRSGISYRKITDLMNKTYPPLRQAKKWHMTQIRRILANAQ